MSISRVFMGWDKPALTLTADYLCARYARNGMLDLQQSIVALPGGRAGRRLFEVLVEHAETRQLGLVPPQIVTVGQLPDLLLRNERPVANVLTQELAWVEALRRTDSNLLVQVSPHLPADDDLFAWLALGQRLADLHRELAGECLTFAEVAARGATLDTFQEAERWQFLATIQAHYLQSLDQAGYLDPQMARLQAVAQGRCHREHDIILLGAADLNAIQRAMLDQVAERVTALIVAPSALSQQFDAYGCVIAPAWQEVRIDLEAAELVFVDSPSQQADAVVRSLARFKGVLAADEVTIGVPDARLVPYVQQRLQEFDVPFRYGVGTPVTQTGPCRLLRAVCEYLDGGAFAAFAKLVRHPAIESWLVSQGLTESCLDELDDYYSSHLPARMNGQWLSERAAGDHLRLAFDAVERLIAPLRGEACHPYAWRQPVADLLVQLYGQAAFDTEDESQRTILIACEQIDQAMHEHLTTPDVLTPRVPGAAALRLLIRALDEVTIPPRFDQSAIELLGWLELPLDDAPALMITGFNEGCVPASQNGELFLPDTLRSHLGLPDQARRYARDAYNLSMIAASRRHVTLIAGRRSPDQEILLPSRLLFACDDDRLLAHTQEAFSSPRPDSMGDIGVTSLRPGRTQGDVAVPRPVPLPEPVTAMRVTEFRDYLTCPYRYYLKHRLRLRKVDTGAEELGPAGFGELLHEVLKGFAAGAAAESLRVAEIREALYQSLEARVRRWFGAEPLPAVRVQVEQARQRLDRFAGWQAGWTQQGWRIEHAEPQVDGERAWLTVDGAPMYLRGRIDRIDIHDKTGQRVIFDYKTGDAAQDPEAAHRQRRSEWMDLQLPLYRHLLAGLGIESDVQLGYILLPKDLHAVGERIAPWSAEDLRQADTVAAEVVRRVRREVFWPPAQIPPAFDDFAAICRTEQLGSVRLAENGG